jgi:hypothetical protein
LYSILLYYEVLGFSNRASDWNREKKCSKITLWSIGDQIRKAHVWISPVKAFTRFETQSGSAVTRACMRGGMWKTGKSGYLSHRHFLLTRFFASKIYLHSRVYSLTSNHGVPMGNPRISVLVTKSAFTYTRRKNHSGGPGNKKCKSLTSKCLGVRAKNVLGSSLLMAHDGHMGQTGYRYVRHEVKLYEHSNAP